MNAIMFAWFKFCDFWSFAERMANRSVEVYVCCGKKFPPESDVPSIVGAAIVGDCFYRDITTEINHYYDTDSHLTTASLDRFLLRNGLGVDKLEHDSRAFGKSYENICVKIMVEGCDNARSNRRASVRGSHRVFLLDVWHDQELLSGASIDSVALSDLLNISREVS